MPATEVTRVWLEDSADSISAKEVRGVDGSAEARCTKRGLWRWPMRWPEGRIRSLVTGSVDACASTVFLVTVEAIVNVLQVDTSKVDRYE